LLGFDFRKPKIYQHFGLSNNVGLTTYLINKATVDDIIQPSGKSEHLDIIMAGPIPPNPAELIASERNAELFRELRERYDYIIIDTPPVGLVTDAYLLMEHTDVNIFLVRQAVTHKKVFASIINDIEERGMKMAIVINDIKLSGGGYGYDPSDVRLKENFESLDNDIAKLQTLEPVSFNMIGDSISDVQLGFIAQNVQEVYPELVRVIDPVTGYLGLNYRQLTSPIISALNQITRTIDLADAPVNVSSITIDKKRQCWYRGHDTNRSKSCCKRKYM